MVLMRLAYVADLPTPGEIVARAPEREWRPCRRRAAHGRRRPSRPRARRPRAAAGRPRRFGHGTGRECAATGTRGAGQWRPARSARDAARSRKRVPGPARTDRTPSSFAELVELFSARKEGDLYAHLTRHVHLVRFETGRLEFRPSERAPAKSLEPHRRIAFGLDRAALAGLDLQRGRRADSARASQRARRRGARQARARASDRQEGAGAVSRAQVKVQRLDMPAAPEEPAEPRAAPRRRRRPTNTRPTMPAPRKRISHEEHGRDHEADPAAPGESRGDAGQARRDRDHRRAGGGTVPVR